MFIILICIGFQLFNHWFIFIAPGQVISMVKTLKEYPDTHFPCIFFNYTTNSAKTTGR